MILPKKNRYFEKILYHYISFQLKTKFHCVWLDDNRNEQKKGSHLLLVNHSSWWDGLIVFYLNYRVIKEDSYAMMSQQGMEEYPFFRKIGAFSVNPNSPKDLIRSLRFAEHVLHEKKSVWIFPQGKEEHLEKRPFQFMSGPSFLIQKVENVTVSPVLFYYTFRHSEKPELFIRISDSIRLSMLQDKSKNQITQMLEWIMEKELDLLKEDIIEERVNTFIQIEKGIPPVRDWFKRNNL